MGIDWLDEKQLLLCLNEMIFDQESVIQDLESQITEIEHNIISQSIKLQSGMITERDFKTVTDLCQLDDLVEEQNQLLAELGKEKEKLSKLTRFSELSNNSKEQRKMAIDTIQKLFD